MPSSTINTKHYDCYDWQHALRSSSPTYTTLRNLAIRATFQPECHVGPAEYGSSGHSGFSSLPLYTPDTIEYRPRTEFQGDYRNAEATVYDKTAEEQRFEAHQEAMSRKVDCIPGASDDETGAYAYNPAEDKYRFKIVLPRSYVLRIPGQVDHRDGEVLVEADTDIIKRLSTAIGNTFQSSRMVNGGIVKRWLGEAWIELGKGVTAEGSLPAFDESDSPGVSFHFGRVSGAQDSDDDSEDEGEIVESDPRCIIVHPQGSTPDIAMVELELVWI